MTVERIPFGGQQSGQEPLAGASPRFLNAVVDTDSQGNPLAIRQRPGLTTWTGLPSAYVLGWGIEGICALDDSTLVYVDSMRTIFEVTAGAVTDLSGTSATARLAGASRPVMARTKTKVVMTGGDVPEKWTGAGSAARIGGNPPPSTHIVPIATRLASNVTTAGYDGLVYWSYAGETGHDTWDALNYAEAEADPDQAVALGTNSNELFVWGERTLQVFAPDPVVGFAPGRALNIGMSAYYSAALVDENWIWLDNRRRFVLSDGRGFQDISAAISHDVYGMSTVEDGWGWRVNMGRLDLYGCVFPTEGRTWVYQPTCGLWSEWRSQTSSGALTNWGGLCLYPWLERNVVLVGRPNGSISELSASTYTDDGVEFPVDIQTGYINRGTDAVKACNRVKFIFRRGTASVGTAAPRVLVYWRDDTGPWSQPEAFDLGTWGDNEPVLELHGLGQYVRRQWRIVFTSATEFIFCGAEEDYTVLTR